MRKETIGDATLYLGDCLEILPTLGRVDACVMDPPYGVGLTAKNHKWFRTEGNGYAGFDDTPEYVETVAVSAVLICRDIARSVVVTPGTECAWKYPAPDDLGAVYNASGTGSGKWGFKCSTPLLFYGKCPYLAAGQGRRANSWEQPAGDYAEKCGHPCPKPIGMMRWLVSRVSLASETVCDPFMGSGTTGVAALQLGRKFIGIEIDPGYFDIACKRIEEAWRQPRLFEEPRRKAEPQPTFFDAEQ